MNFAASSAIMVSTMMPIISIMNPDGRLCTKPLSFMFNIGSRQLINIKAAHVTGRAAGALLRSIPLIYTK